MQELVDKLVMAGIQEQTVKVGGGGVLPQVLLRVGRRTYIGLLEAASVRNWIACELQRLYGGGRRD